MVAQSRPILLLTRPEPAASRFARLVRAKLGDRLAIVISPLMAPVFLPAALPKDDWQGTIFTSETGVEGLRRLTARRGPALCVGPRTAEAATAAGWQGEVLGGDAARLVAALSVAPRQGAWLHARARDAAADLVSPLRAAGMQVAEAIVYAQEPCSLSEQARSVLDGRIPVIVPLFSPRSARLFVAEAQEALVPVNVVAISKAAADAAEPLSPARVEIAPTPDAPGMLAGLLRLLAAGATA